MSIQSLNGFKVETFDQLRRIIQVSVENIQTRTIAGELDASDAVGTDIRLMNYSYTNAASSREKERKSRYDVNVIDEDVDEDKLQLLEGSENIKIRQVIKQRELKDSLFRVDNLLKTTFAIIAMAKVISVGIAPGTIYLDVIKMSTR